MSCDKLMGCMKCACAQCAGVRAGCKTASAVRAALVLTESLYGSLDPGSPHAEAAVGLVLTLVDDVVSKAQAEDDSAPRS